MKKLRILNAIVCEYVAQGFANKHTLVNVFSGNIRVGSFPAQFRIGLYVEFEILKGQPAELKLEMRLGDDVLLNVEGELNAADVGDAAVLTIQSIPLNVHANTVLRVFATSPGFGQATVIEKTITQGTIETLRVGAKS